MKILALGHRKRIGKDTLARFIVTYLRTHTKNFNIQKVGFADKLKDITHELFRWAGLMDGPFYETNPDQREIILPAIGKTPREIWIEISNKIREVYEHVWIDYVLHKTYCDYLIITDLRYPNEFIKIKEMGGFTCKLIRPNIPNTDDKADIALHHYEDSKWDYIIMNNSNLNELNKHAEWLAQKLIES